MGRNLLLLDFDGTITQHDTLNSLVTLSIAAATTPKPNSTTNHHANTTTGNNSNTTSDTNRETLTALWKEIVRDYTAAHAAHVASYTPRADARQTPAAELAFLETLGPVEAGAVGRVSRGGFFRGLSAARLRAIGRAASSFTSSSAAASQGGARGGGEGESEDGDEGEVGDQYEEGGEEDCRVQLRRGFAEFLDSMAGDEGGREKWDVAVVSINWSGEFIRGVVEGGCVRGEGGVRRVVANGVSCPDGEIQGPSELGREPLSTAGDKLRAMRSLREGLKEEKVVYFGDSTTDLACLLAADFGVVMATDSESKLLGTLRRVGIEVPHVGDAGAGHYMAWARDFVEVLQSGVMDRIEA